MWSEICLCQHSVRTSTGQYCSVVLTRASESLMQLNGHNAGPRWAVSRQLCRQVHFSSLQVGRLVPFTEIFHHSKCYNSVYSLWQWLLCNVASMCHVAGNIPWFAYTLGWQSAAVQTRHPASPLMLCGSQKASEMKYEYYSSQHNSRVFVIYLFIFKSRPWAFGHLPL